MNGIRDAIQSKSPGVTARIAKYVRMKAREADAA
jgi:hypothetical protein